MKKEIIICILVRQIMVCRLDKIDAYPLTKLEQSKTIQLRNMNPRRENMHSSSRIEKRSLCSGDSND